jgi:hypothetical protein
MVRKSMAGGRRCVFILDSRDYSDEIQMRRKIELLFSNEPCFYAIMDFQLGMKVTYLANG